jgi:phospholipase A1/A2
MIWRFLTGSAFLLGFVFPAHAALMLTQSSPRAVAGEPLTLNVLVLNEGSAPQNIALPPHLDVRVVTTQTTYNAQLSLVAPTAAAKSAEAAALAPGQFRRVPYRIVLPDGISGPVAIELHNDPGGRLIVMAERRTSVAETPNEADPKATVTAALRETDTIPQPALQTFEPMYFVVGRRDDLTTARFQLSFKYRLFDEQSVLGTLFEPASRLYFGYTQTSLWDLSEASAPFRDTAYRPSIFYLDPEIWASTDGTTSLGIQAGLEHESNGRSDLESRSINIAYVKPTWRRFIGKDWYVSVSPKIWTYIDRDGNNDDIAEYRGYADLNLRLGEVNGWLFSADLRKGTSHFGSVQLDVSYPIRTPFFSNAGGFIHFQYFNGYGESLLDYDVKGPAQYRIGFSIVR